MTLDLPFLSWIVSRRMPIFAVVMILIIIVGNIFVSRVTPSYFATSKLQVAPDFLQSNSERGDAKTDFEFLKFKVMTSSMMSELIVKWGPLEANTQAHFDSDTSSINIGVYHTSPETAQAAALALVELFSSTAEALKHQNLSRMIAFRQAEVDTLRQSLESGIEVAGAGLVGGSTFTQSDFRKTNNLLTAAMERLTQSKALLLVPEGKVLRVVENPAIPTSPSGPQRRAMLFALTAFAIFCALITIIILEWLDTVIRRPRDIERNLGLSTFGVIPELQPQPIKK